MTPVVEPAAGAFGLHPIIFPVIDANRKLALQVALAQVPGRTKSAAAPVLATVPVGRPGLPGMVTVGMLALSTTGALPTSPRMSCVVLVPLLATQKGLDAVAVSPHGLTSSGSRTGARPGMSEIKFV